MHKNQIHQAMDIAARMRRMVLKKFFVGVSKKGGTANVFLPEIFSTK